MEITPQFKSAVDRLEESVDFLLMMKYWSDAARAAAQAARASKNNFKPTGINQHSADSGGAHRASLDANQSTNRTQNSNNPELHKLSAGAHEHAAATHRIAAASQERAGNQEQAKLHNQAAAAHDKVAQEHHAAAERLGK